MDRLSPLDAAFLSAEDADPHVSMAIASVAVFEGPAPGIDEVIAAFNGRLPLLPRYRQRIRRAPFALAPPAWVDDPDFDIWFHVRRTALPSPGGDAELFALISRLMAQRLDRDRPLWETWLIEGLAGNRWALLSKVHHCMVDGVGGTDLYHLLLSPTADAAPPPPVPDLDWPQPVSTGRLLVDAVTTAAAVPLRQLRAAVTAARRPLDAVRLLRTTARGLLASSPVLLPSSASTLPGHVGGQRRYAAAVVPLHELKEIAARLGVTVNDVALAVTSGGFRALLTRRGEHGRPHAVRSLVPVSVRPPGAEHTMANRVSCMFADLPVHLDNPLERVRHVHDELAGAKAHHEAEAGAVVVELAAKQPFSIVSPLLRTAFSVPQYSLVTVTTNVPGPRAPLFLMGRRMLRMLPYVPIADQVRIGVAILSYCDEVAFGVTADYDSGRDLETILDGIRADLAALTPRPAPA